MCVLSTTELKLKRQRGGIRTFQALCLVGLVCSVVCGCSRGESAIKLYRVSGILTRQGQPVSNCVIHFVPAKGRPSAGLSRQDGKFSLYYDRDRAGAIPGVHKVWVEYRPKDPAEDMAIRQGNSPLPTDLQKTLKKYGSVKQTSLLFTIDRDEIDLPISLD